MNKLNMFVSAVACTFLFSGIKIAQGESETFFVCGSGYQFETKKKSARCIKQERLSFKSPESCSKRNTSKTHYNLSVDKRAKNDFCAAKIAGTANDFVPLCPKGFRLQVKRGKDVCAKGSPQKVKPVDKKVIR